MYCSSSGVCFLFIVLDFCELEFVVEYIDIGTVVIVADGCDHCVGVGGRFLFLASVMLYLKHGSWSDAFLCLLVGTIEQGYDFGVMNLDAWSTTLAGYVE